MIRESISKDVRVWLGSTGNQGNPTEADFSTRKATKAQHPLFEQGKFAELSPFNSPQHKRMWIRKKRKILKYLLCILNGMDEVEWKGITLPSS